MRVLIADQFSANAIEEMKAAGMQVLYNDKLAGDAFKQALAEHKPSVLVVRSKKVDAGIIDAGDKLQLIVRAGAGTDTIDVKHAAKKGIYVANCPGKNANAVSELTIGLILSIDRRIAEGNELLHQGKWNKGMFTNCKGIKGRTLGLIGFGNIAQGVCKAARALDMNVLVHTRTIKDGLDEALGFEYVSLDDLLARSDIVSLHTPSTAETKGLVNKAFLDKIKPDGVLINTARGNVVVDEDLLEKLNQNPDFWVGTDVFNGEPTVKEVEWTSPLSTHPRVYGTHHCGASTQQAETAIGNEALRVIKKFAQTGEIDIENTVNRAKKDAKLHKLSVRHFDKVGVLLHVLTVFKEHNLNIQELQNIVFEGREACVANITFSGDFSESQLISDKIRSHEDILDVSI